MYVTRLSYNISQEMARDKFLLQEFYNKAMPDHYIPFFHINCIVPFHLLNNHKPSNTHTIVPCCSICGNTSSYNYGGYGLMYLRHNGIDAVKLLNGKLRKFHVFCENHLNDLMPFKKQVIKTESTTNQLSLF